MYSSYNFTTKNEAETLSAGEVIGSLAKKGTVIALVGELGAGKTVLAKGIAKGLGTEKEPNSPTFVILNIYKGRYTLNHFDLYRLSTEEELEDIGFGEIINGDGVSVVEWADKIPGMLPEDRITVEIYHCDGDNNNFTEKREIVVKGNKEWVSLFKNTVEQASQTSKR